MNWTQRLITLVVVPALVALAGCATNALRVEAAKDVAAKGKAVADSSRAYLDQVERMRYDYNVEIIAADPVCRGERATVRQPPRNGSIIDPRRPPRGWLCTTLPARVPGHHGLMLGSIHDELAPTIALVESLSAYSAAITDVLEAPHSDPAADFDHAIETANAAKDLLESLGATIGGVTEERTDAVRGFIAFVSELSQEADTVARLRRLAQPEGGAGQLIDTLRRHLGTWEESRASQESAAVNLSEVLLRASTNPRAPLTADQRRRFAQTYYERLYAQNTSGQVKEALDHALAAFATAETDYRQLLRDHPSLSPKQRARRAEIIRQRLTRALQTATALITAFGA